MSAQIPDKVAHSALSEELARSSDLIVLNQGKVRDTFGLQEHPNLLLPEASDRASIFDFVLNVTIPDKGAVLTAMTVFWLRNILSDWPNHLVAAGQEVLRFLPPSFEDNLEVQTNCLVVKRCEMLPLECIVRGYLTGSGLASYQRTTMVCGVTLPPELHDGSPLARPIFTPSSKADEGHDEHVDRHWVYSQYGWWPEKFSIAIYHAAAEWAKNRGVLLADTKFEFGTDGTLADEVVTPDSSRFWDRGEWTHCQEKGVAPPAWDKQELRKWGIMVETPFGVTGINELSPENPEHRKFVHNLVVPPAVVDRVRGKYLTIFERITGKLLQQFQREDMGIDC